MNFIWVILLTTVNLALLAGTICVLVLVAKQSARIAHLDAMSKKLMAELEEHAPHGVEPDDADALRHEAP